MRHFLIFSEIPSGIASLAAEVRYVTSGAPLVVQLHNFLVSKSNRFLARQIRIADRATGQYTPLWQHITLRLAAKFLIFFVVIEEYSMNAMYSMSQCRQRGDDSTTKTCLRAKSSISCVSVSTVERTRSDGSPHS